MAGSDPKTSRAFGQTSARPDIEAEEDPLVELARIVSEDGAFSAPKPAKPKAVRPEKIERPAPIERDDFADGLEAELLQELESSFGGRDTPAPAPMRSPAPVRATPVPPPPAAPTPRASAAPVARAPARPATKRPPEELDPDELLRSIEEQLGQFERRHAARFGAASPSASAETEAESTGTAAAEPDEPIFGATRAEAQSRRSSRIRPFAEIDEPEVAAEEPVIDELPPIPAPVRSEYRFRGPANAEWDRMQSAAEPIEPSAAGLQPQEQPSLYAEPRADTDLFAGEAPDSLGERVYPSEAAPVEDAIEARRRERRETEFPEFEDVPVVAAARPDLTEIEASLSRELEPEYAASSQEDKWQDGDAPDDEPPAAATIAPGASRRAAAARAAAEQRGRSRAGLLTAAGVIGVVVIGAAAALYLRSSEEGSSGPPPVIAADDEPVRIAPAEGETASQETVGEAVYNRVAGATSETPEQVVESAEEPSEIARIVLPPTQAGSEETVVGPVGEETAGASTGGEQAAANSPAPAAQSTEPASQATDEIGPRRVPTYVVRADGSIVETSAAPPTAPDAASAQSEQLASETAPIEPTPVETVAIPDSGAVTDSGLPPPVPPPETAEAAPPGAADDLTPRPTIDDPPAEIAAAPAEPPAEPAAEAGAPTELAAVAPETIAAPAPTASGGFLVQLSAQRSMEQAQAAYAKAQQDFASVLGSLPPQIQEADLGAKGIYFRVRVGPWATRDEAIGVCESLKAVGGSCFVTQ